MTDDQEHQAPELQLELLLQELLGEAPAQPSGALRVEVAPEAAELADVARRLRAASQWFPLPEGQKGLRKTLVTAAEARLDGHALPQAAGRAPRLRPRRRILIPAAAIAALLILGVFGAGTSLAWNVGSPASPWYGTRVAVEELQVALAPTPGGKAKLLVRATRTRIAEIETVASSGDTPALRRAADVLDSEANWLHAVTTTLPAADRDRVMSELTAVTGTFSEAILSGLAKGSTSPFLEHSGKAAAERGARVITVARAAAQLKAEGKLAPGVTVGDLVSQAARGNPVVVPGGLSREEHEFKAGPTGQEIVPKSNETGKSSGNLVRQTPVRRVAGTHPLQPVTREIPSVPSISVPQAQGPAARGTPRGSAGEPRPLEGPAGKGGLFGSGGVGFAGSHLDPYSGGFTGDFRGGPNGASNDWRHRPGTNNGDDTGEK